jgi:hypothetical protein
VVKNIMADDRIESLMVPLNLTSESRISNSVGQGPTRKATTPFVRLARARAKEETKQLKSIHLC